MAEQQRWALSIPLEGVTLADHRAILDEAERLGYTDAWTQETDGVDCFTPLALAVAWTEKLRVGTAIANVYTRTPSVLAMSAVALADAAPGRFVLGLGSSSPVIVQEWGGVPFEEPYKQLRDTTLALREVLAHKRVTMDTDRLHMHGFRVSRPPAVPVPIYLAALRPGMLRLAGRLGDGVIINWLSPADVRKVVGIAKEAAANAGRDAAALEVVCRVFVMVTDDVEAAQMRARREIAAYLTTPVYEAFHAWLGRGEVFRPMTEAWRASDRRGALALVPDQAVEDLFIIGNGKQCRERVLEYCANGVTTPVLYFMPVGGENPGQQSIMGMRALAPATA